jgi:aspartokinase-like uncharacterized kinase
VFQLLVTANDLPSSPILVTLMMEANFLPKHRLLKDSHGVTSQKIAFFIVNTVKNSNLTYYKVSGFYTQKKAFFIVTAVKTSNLT